MNIHNFSLHHIDRDRDSVSAVPREDVTRDAITYTNALIEFLFSKSNKRAFKFESEDCSSFLLISRLLDGEFRAASDGMAMKLLRTEQKAQEKFRHLKGVQKGSLLQHHVNINGSNYILITKIDHNSFLGQEDLIKHIGLPFEQRILKSCIINLNDDNQIELIQVYDSTSKLTAYWYESFLELIELKSDEKNTKEVVASVRKTLATKKRKKLYPSDYTYLLNSFLVYLEQHPTFDFDEMFETVFESYSPIEESYPLDKVKHEVKIIAESGSIDRRFEIFRSALPQRPRAVDLHNKIVLQLRGGIDNLEDIIDATEDEEGNKYVTIKSESGYRHFKK